ncbi:MAG: hypothetical protein GXP40_04395 [Chloroflexi bacterium]|nr:hypothetical protein [Chloroflexota bacterium]
MSKTISPKYLLIAAVFVVSALALTACGSAGANTPDVVEVQVTLTEFAFESSITTFEVGVPYRFVITNKGAIPHELMIIPKLDKSASDADMEAIDELALAVVEEDELPAGATATLDYTFTEPADSGKLEFACYLPGHYESGMYLPITVR